ADEAYDNVVILLDTSCSMDSPMHGGQSKMDAAKIALKKVIGKLPRSTHVGLLTFEGDWVIPLGPRDDLNLISAVERPYPSGGTPLGQYVKVGADRLLVERDKQHGYGSYRLLVVTDGEASDQRKLDRFVPDVVSRGIVLDTIGVAMDSDHTLQKQSHTYRSADNPDSLIQAVEEVFAEVSFSGSDNVGDDAFAEIDGLPDTFAMTLIEVLSTTYANHPIGQKPQVKGEPGAPVNAQLIADTGDPDCSTLGTGLMNPLWFLLVLPLIRRRNG
ncbi:MAG: VWA domain-containing protein, partial [Proteobacteria bacterium]|nr:VWA domain-containing protein [Pseudomonadota bacterium]